MNVKLVVIGGKKDGLEIPVATPTFLIGRDRSCHLRPESKFINLIHCQLSLDNDTNSVAIVDCSGAVGTFVNGERIKWQHTLNNGDRIRIDALEFEVRIGEGETEEDELINSLSNSAAPLGQATEMEKKIITWVKPDNPVRKFALAVVHLSTFWKGKYQASDESIDAETGQQLKQVRKGFDLSRFDLLLLLTIGTFILVISLMAVPGEYWEKVGTWISNVLIWCRYDLSRRWWRMPGFLFGLVTFLSTIIGILLLIRNRRKSAT
jgi:pSer/pThr/pTyr-binding forkhead associated (FHA) protein